MADSIGKKEKYRARLARVSCIDVYAVYGIYNLFQKYKNRMAMIRESEAKYWEGITIDFMSEESDDDHKDTIIVKKLMWRSSGMLYSC